jgi:large subunit ribosomal protein L30
MSKIVVKQIKSPIGKPEHHRRILRSLGFRKMNKEKVFNDNNCIRGAINKISYMLDYKIVSDK